MMGLKLFKSKSLTNPEDWDSAPMPETRVDGPYLEGVLMQLSKWGKPRIGQYGTKGGWHCCVEVNVTPTGVSFEAKSEFNHATPLDAALTCQKNLFAAVNALGGSK